LPKKKKSAAELVAENKLLRRANLALGINNVLVNLIRWGAVVLIFRYGFLSIEALSGKATLASVGISFLGNLTVSQSLAYILGGGGLIYGMAEHGLRKRLVKRIGGRTRTLEAAIDPRRTSSNLTEIGETNPHD
jgi:hypothetical protein